MGAWGEGNFENDDAMDWVGDLEQYQGLSDLMKVLAPVATAGAAIYIEAPDCCRALAGAETVAAARGKPSQDLPDGVHDWISNHKGNLDPALLDAAKKTVERIKTSSELKELWEEGDPESWQKVIASLELRLA